MIWDVIQDRRMTRMSCQICLVCPYGVCMCRCLSGVGGYHGRGLMHTTFDGDLPRTNPLNCLQMGRKSEKKR